MTVRYACRLLLTVHFTGHSLHPFTVDFSDNLKDASWTRSERHVLLFPCHGEDVFGVSDESVSRDAGGEIPEAKLAVPASGKRELAVGGEDDVFDEVGVAGEPIA
ncbi:hypothetical protein F2Q70_00023069 [Brassica cretica]|uniref:Uncharacterized protein n=1 Tax=Brassica cretica TaxID=69181 RepID=A0A8S9GFT3_BRACR|nr:hypothetical protein F2Q70_00023069 [Brassica cretica]